VGSPEPAGGDRRLAGRHVAAEESDDGPLRVTEDHLHAALAELRRGGDELTQTLLGARAPEHLGEELEGLEDM